MTHASWIDTVWSMCGTMHPVFGCVRAVEGEDLTISVIGPAGQQAQGLHVLAHSGKRRCARIPVAALLRDWALVDGVKASAFRGHTLPIGVGNA